ncbi:MAG: hypothetical protein MUO76_14275, partial [Anaerolineaceae bacterium]|nr:hypothetical protein [Anaerolineaceae bacterium]
ISPAFPHDEITPKPNTIRAKKCFLPSSFFMLAPANFLAQSSHRLLTHPYAVYQYSRDLPEILLIYQSDTG